MILEHKGKTMEEKFVESMDLEAARCESAPPKRPDRARRKELLQLAETISVLVQEQAAKTERCLLRRMVEMFLES